MTLFPVTLPTASDWVARVEALRENVPVIACTTGPDAPNSRQPEFGTWKFLCPHCGETHHHGSGEGPRAANCNDPTSPYHDGGYYLVHESYA